MAWTERYCRSDAAGGGDGTTNTNSGANGAWTLAEAITNAASGHRVNIRAGTYANTTTSRTFSNAGTATAPIWWRGFNTTIGDCDTDPSLTRPLITFTTGSCAFTGGHAWFSSVSWESSRTTGAGFASSAATTPIIFVDCLFTATGANANSSAWSMGNATNCRFMRCGFVATTTATGTVLSNAGTGNSQYSGCWFEGGATYCVITGNSGAYFDKCIFYDGNGDGIRIGGTGLVIVNDCDFNSLGSDGIEMTNNNISNLIVNCTFTSNGGYGINNNTGGNLNSIRMCNFFYNNTSGEENGFGDSPSPSNVSGSASPYVDAANRNMRKTTASEIQDKGFPLWWVKNAWPSSADGTNEFGAMQPATSSGGGLAANPLRGFIL